MKKLLNIMLAICLLSTSSCRSDNFSAISRGVNTISTCLTSLSSARIKIQEKLPLETAKSSEKTNFSSYLPHYSWDSKMMVR
jgi:hypothetical protein